MAFWDNSHYSFWDLWSRDLKILLGYDTNHLSILPFMCHLWFPIRKASKLSFVCFRFCWKKVNVGLCRLFHLCMYLLSAIDQNCELWSKLQNHGLLEQQTNLRGKPTGKSALEWDLQQCQTNEVAVNIRGLTPSTV